MTMPCRPCQKIQNNREGRGKVRFIYVFNMIRNVSLVLSSHSGSNVSLQKHIISRLRRFSTESMHVGPTNSTSSSAAINTGTSVASKMKKHLLWIVPLVSGFTLTIIVRSNEKPKEWVESIAPRYIDLVREYWGFDEENLEENYRLQRLQREIELPVNVTLSKSHLDVVQDSVTFSVSGNMLESELMEFVRKEYPKFASARGSSLMHFNDSTSKGNAGELISEHQLNKNFIADNNIEAIIERGHNKALQNVPIANFVQDDVYTWLQCHSMWKGTEGTWSTFPSNATEQKKRIKQLMGVGNDGMKNPFLDGGLTAMKLALLVPFQNAVSYYVYGLRTYQVYVEGASKDTNAFRVLFAQSLALQRWAKKDADMRLSNGELRMTKAEALQRIEDLSKRLAIQQRDFELGRKGYDVSISEMDATKTEIQTLRRKYVNWFYYF